MAANKLSSLMFVVSACGMGGARLYGQSAPDDINEGRSEVAVFVIVSHGPTTRETICGSLEPTVARTKICCNSWLQAASILVAE